MNTLKSESAASAFAANGASPGPDASPLHRPPGAWGQTGAEMLLFSRTPSIHHHILTFSCKLGAHARGMLGVVHVCCSNTLKHARGRASVSCFSPPLSLHFQVFRALPQRPRGTHNSRANDSLSWSHHPWSRVTAFLEVPGSTPVSCPDAWPFSCGVPLFLVLFFRRTAASPSLPSLACRKPPPAIVARFDSIRSLYDRACDSDSKLELIIGSSLEAPVNILPKGGTVNRPPSVR